VEKQTRLAETDCLPRTSMTDVNELRHWTFKTSVMLEATDTRAEKSNSAK
jgi:hypothetical protein